MNFDTLTEIHNADLFRLVEQNHELSVHEHDLLIQGIEIKMSLDLVSIERNVYTVLDLLSDIGGLQGSFVSVIGFLVSIWNYK